MRWIISLVILVVIVFALEFYAFQALKTVSKSKIIRYSWVLISLVVYVNFFYVVISYDRTLGQTPKFQMAMGVMLTVLLPKLVVLIAMFGEDVYRSILKLFSVISSGETKSFAGRRKFISQLALGLAAIPFAAFIYGIIPVSYTHLRAHET